MYYRDIPLSTDIFITASFNKHLKNYDTSNNNTNNSQKLEKSGEIVIYTSLLIPPANKDDNVINILLHN